MTYISRLSHVFSLINRKRKVGFVGRFIRRRGIRNCLIVGCIPRGDDRFWENVVEIGILETLGSNVVFSGLEQNGGSWPSWIQADGRFLPFSDGSFDLVLSNAVLEHVGTLEDQRKFIYEHARCGKNWIITTPNRLFPIESHTQVFFKHMKRNWHHGDLRLLSKGEIKKIAPSNSKVKGFFLAPTFIAYNKVP